MVMAVVAGVCDVPRSGCVAVPIWKTAARWRRHCTHGAGLNDILNRKKANVANQIERGAKEIRNRPEQTQVVVCTIPEVTRCVGNYDRASGGGGQLEN